MNHRETFPLTAEGERADADRRGGRAPHPDARQAPGRTRELRHLLAAAAALTDRAVRFTRSGIARGAALSLAIKVGSAGLTLIIFTLASHAMDAVTFGRLSMCFNALSFAAVLTVFGQDNLIVRSWSEHCANGAAPLARGAYLHGWQVVAVTTGLAVIVTLAVSICLGASPVMAAAGATFLAAQTFTHYSSHSSRLICSQLIADGNREFPWRLAVLVAAASFLASGRALPIPAFFFSAAAGMAVAIIIQSTFVAFRFPQDVRAARSERRSGQWIAASFGLWFPAVLEAAAQYAEVILIGLLLDPLAAGGYFVAMRFAAVFPMVATGLNAYALNRVAGFHFQGRTQDLARLLRSLMTVGTTLTFGLFAVTTAAGPWLLGLFGSRYAGEYPTLAVLALGTAAVTLAGPTSVALLTTGHEFIYSRTITLALLARFGLMAVLVPHFGAFGAATAWTVSSVPGAIVLVIACRRVLGIDPSALCLLRGTKRITSRA